MNKTKATFLTLGLAVASAAFFTACDAGTFAPGAQGGTGTLRLLITDKPFPFQFIEKAEVTITRIEVRGIVDEGNDGNENGNENSNENGNGNENENENGNENENENENSNGNDNTNTNDNTDDDDDESFITISTTEQTFNLLDLQNGRTDLLAETEIPAGLYTQMRIFVTLGHIYLTDGRDFPLTVPSGAQSGIKLNFTFSIERDMETTLLLDVDLSRAFKPIPGGRIDDVSAIREFKFSPSIAMRLINVLNAGTIEGTVTDDALNPLIDVSVTAFLDDEEVGSTATDADGLYIIGGLLTGTYRLEFSADGFEDAEVTEVDVHAGNTTDVDNVELVPVP